MLNDNGIATSPIGSKLVPPGHLDLVDFEKVAIMCLYGLVFDGIATIRSIVCGIFDELFGLPQLGSVPISLLLLVPCRTTSEARPELREQSNADDACKEEGG